MIYDDIINRMIMHSSKELKVGLKHVQGVSQGLSLQAVKKIEKGEIVVTEAACLTFPDPGAHFGENGYDELESYYSLSRRPTNRKVCVGCCTCLNSQEFESCQVCCSPVCGPSCKSLSAHEAECQLLAELRKNPAIVTLLDSSEVQGQVFYDFVAVIRMLKFQLKLNALSSLTSLVGCLFFVEDRFRTGPFAKDREDDIKIYTSLFQYLPTEWLLWDGLKYDCSAPELMNYCFNALNIIKIFGVPHSSELSFFCRHMYWLASFIRHSCVPNVDITTDDDGRVKVKALKSIDEGDELVHCFVNILRPTYDRHAALQVQRLTECHCQRCLDPSEFETYIGSVKCEDNHCGGSTRGFVVMDTDKNIKKNAHYNEWVWKCINCNSIVDHCELIGKMDIITAGINSWSPENQVDFNFIKQEVEQINHRHSTFHPGHWLPLLLHKKLANLMSLSYEMWNWGIDPMLISRKVDILSDLLQVYIKLQCGRTPSAAKIRVEILDLTYRRMKHFQEGCTSGGSELTSNEKRTLFQQAAEIYDCVNHIYSTSKFGDIRTMAYFLMQKLHKHKHR